MKEVPNLKEKTCGSFKLSASKWTSMELMRDVLQVGNYKFVVIFESLFIGACECSTIILHILAT
jgi:hypothetical protein